MSATTIIVAAIILTVALAAWRYGATTPKPSRRDMPLRNRAHHHEQRQGLTVAEIEARIEALEKAREEAARRGVR